MRIAALITSKIIFGSSLFDLRYVQTLRPSEFCDGNNLRNTHNTTTFSPEIPQLISAADTEELQLINGEYSIPWFISSDFGVSQMR